MKQLTLRDQLKLLKWTRYTDKATRQLYVLEVEETRSKYGFKTLLDEPATVINCCTIMLEDGTVLVDPLSIKVEE